MNESFDDLDMYDGERNQGVVESENDIETEADRVVEAHELPKKRKRVTPPYEVPTFIDEKCKHLEKTLSASQRDQLLINEAREDTRFRKDLTKAMRKSTESFSQAL